jgi:hypothetical protein
VEGGGPQAGAVEILVLRQVGHVKTTSAMTLIWQRWAAATRSRRSCSLPRPAMTL